MNSSDLDPASRTTPRTTERIGLIDICWEDRNSLACRGSEALIHYGWFPSRFGDALVLATPDEIVGMAFAQVCGRDDAEAAMRRRWPDARFQESPEQVEPVARRALDTGEARVRLAGSAFQHRVWRELLEIPRGSTATYGEIAARLGMPGGSRAVGRANGANPVAWLVPCHRVIAAGGHLGGYGWGLPVKQAMLDWEAGTHTPA